MSGSTAVEELVGFGFWLLTVDVDFLFLMWDVEDWKPVRGSMRAFRASGSAAVTSVGHPEKTVPFSPTRITHLQKTVDQPDSHDYLSTQAIGNSGLTIDFFWFRLFVNCGERMASTSSSCKG